MKKLLCLFGLGMMVQNEGCGWLFDCCSGKSDVSIEEIRGHCEKITHDYIHFQQWLINDHHQTQKTFRAYFIDLRHSIVDLLRETRDLKNRLKPDKDAQTKRRALTYKKKTRSGPFRHSHKTRSKHH